MDSRRNQIHDGDELRADFPFVRVIVVAYNGSELTMKCLNSLIQTDWPPDRLEIILVDNASSDDTVDRCKREFPTVRIVLSHENLGFSGGCNLGLTAETDYAGRSLVDYDHVALINNDALVDSSWLEELTAVLESGIDIGASAAKVLLAPKFSEIRIAPLMKGLVDGPLFCISGVKIDGTRQDHRLRFDETFLRTQAHGHEEVPQHWTRRGGAIRIIQIDGDSADLMRVEIGLNAPTPMFVEIQAGTNSLTTHLDGQNTPAQWIEISVEKESFDVINSVGCELYRRGFGGDRGYLERDSGQFDESVEVFAWSGAAVLLRRSFLEDVGLFDSRLFLYYEDFDLSWRGRLAGWRYLYAPRAVVRHHHAQTSVEGSDLFQFFTTRNRLLVSAKNAPLRIAVRAGAGEILRLVRCLWQDVIIQVLTWRSPRLSGVKSRLKVVCSYLALLPAMLYQRWSMERRVSRRRLMSWEKEKTVVPGFTESDVEMVQ